jgi:hypothetical protein
VVLERDGENVVLERDGENVVLERDGENHIDRLCEKLRSITKSQGRQKYPTNNTRKGG